LALVGLKDLYYAKLTKDDGTGINYDTPSKIAGAINAKISPSVNTGILYADDGPDETISALSEISVELQVKDLPLSIQAVLLGHTINGTTKIMRKNADDVAPYVAIGFKSLKSNGKYRYTWLYKGKFQLVKEEYKTKEENIEFQTPTIEGKFVKRQNDEAWMAQGDEDATGWTASVGTGWFTKPFART
jgi:phi13 family phage major tail protein